jgi:transglutaminase-like putative cysteine protease
MLAATVLATAASAEEPRERFIELVYEFEMAALPDGHPPVDVWLPVAQDDANQEILSYDIDANFDGAEQGGLPHGNRVWHGRVLRMEGRSLSVTARYLVRRRTHSNTDFERAEGRRYGRSELRRLAPYLAANARVPIAGEPVDSVSAEIAPGVTDPVVVARAIFDHVVDTMEYKKVGSGWGNGDTYWACSERYGNCTDFHALFSSLARARGIPARFSIGFPVPLDRDEGAIGGYHCWVEFYLPAVGWVPVDASEAKKHPESRDLFFGTHPPDRVQFTTGRDLTLGQQGPPLNYFIDPYVEVGGVPYESFQRDIHFRASAGERDLGEGSKPRGE